MEGAGLEEVGGVEDGAMEESARIGQYMRGLLERYEAVRGRSPAEVGEPFWDLVVISAGDAAQEVSYRAQLHVKREQGELPLVPFLCLADPPGPRVGSGGSTLHVLKELEQKHPGKLDTWRVLLIHAGGYSKRLPSHSCAGKIFSPLPISTAGGAPFQMLDLKLALYLPFLAAMEPGVFVTASDDIEVFRLAPGPQQGGRGETVTALAHPSSLFIGTTHGVYVLGEGEVQEKGEVQEVQELRSCLEVLQKPSEATMRSRGAVVAQARGAVVARAAAQETVYSDSAFWFHAPTTRKLLELGARLGPLDTELCIYGDLLTCLGQRPDRQHPATLRAMDSKAPGVAARRALQESLGDTPLAVLALHCSKFYHLGTTQEYLEGLTSDRHLRAELNLASVVCSRVAEGGAGLQGLVLHSSLARPVTLPPDSIIEYSVIEAEVTLGPRTLLSGVHLAAPLALPAGFLYHTVPVLAGEGEGLFVTVAFHIMDDMKASVEQGQEGSLHYGGHTVASLRLPTTTLALPPGPASLWSARIFPARTSMADSLAATASLVSSLSDPSAPAAVEERRYSMEQLVECKDCDAMLAFRQRLAALCRD